MEDYLDRKFEAWFTMPLEFSDEINNIIKEAARVSFKQGYLTPEPSLLELTVSIASQISNKN